MKKSQKCFEDRRTSRTSREVAEWLFGCPCDMRHRPQSGALLSFKYTMTFRGFAMDSDAIGLAATDEAILKASSNS